jgi:mannan endo-1,4-beta-mannosidase
MRRLNVFGLAVMLALFLPLAVKSVNGQDIQPANPNANAQVRDMLTFIAGLNERADTRIMVGQFGIYGAGQTYAVGMQTIQAAQTTMGQLPALTGADYAAPGGVVEVNRFVADNWARGMWPIVSWHAENPCTGGSASKSEGTNFSLKAVLPGGTCHAAWLRSLDRISGALAGLQAQGIPVIWRPFHENNGPWFWWGANASVQDFVALWRHMFSYFTDTKGLNNLLWAFSPNHKWDQWAARVNTYYPGDAYVDIFGIDLYMECTRTDDPNWRINIDASYADMRATGKPLGLLEFGFIPASGQCWDVNPYPYRWDEFIAHLQTHYPDIVMFQAWEYVWQIGRSPYRGQREMINHPWALTANELPRLGSGEQPQPVTPSATATRTPTATQMPSHTPTILPTTPAPVLQLPVCFEVVIRFENGQQQPLLTRLC